MCPKTTASATRSRPGRRCSIHIDIPATQGARDGGRDGEFGGDLAAAALAYEQLLAANAEPGEQVPNFDVHLLGMGPEGHINSLFPDTPAVLETTRMVVAVDDSPKPPPQRITLTLPAIRRSREVWLLVSGASKADAVAAAIGGAEPVSIPAAGAIGPRPRCGCSTHEAAKLPAGRPLTLRSPAYPATRSRVAVGESPPAHVLRHQSDFLGSDPDKYRQHGDAPGAKPNQDPDPGGGTPTRRWGRSKTSLDGSARP